MHGYFGIGIYHTKTEVNVGTLWRSAYQLGAAYIFTIGRRYKHQSSDTTKAWRHVPLFHYDNWEQFYRNLPHDCRIVGVEIGGEDLREYDHLPRCVYVLGAEDNGLPSQIIEQCHNIVAIPSVRSASYNVAVAGSLIMYDRLSSS